MRPKRQKDLLNTVVRATAATEAYLDRRSNATRAVPARVVRQLPPKLALSNEPLQSEVKDCWLNRTDKALVACLASFALPDIVNAQGIMAASTSNLSVVRVGRQRGSECLEALAASLALEILPDSLNPHVQFHLELVPSVSFACDRLDYTRKISLTKQVLQAKKIYCPVRFAMKVEHKDWGLKSLLIQHRWSPRDPGLGFITARERFGLKLDPQREGFYFLDANDAISEV